MRKPDFCICENKDADQLCGKLISAFVSTIRTYSTIPPLSGFRNSKPLAIFRDSTAWFVSDMVENPEDQFSQNEAHIIHCKQLKTCRDGQLS